MQVEALEAGPPFHLTAVLNDVFGSPSSSDSEGGSHHEGSRSVNVSGACLMCCPVFLRSLRGFNSRFHSPSVHEGIHLYRFLISQRLCDHLCDRSRGACGSDAGIRVSPTEGDSAYSSRRQHDTAEVPDGRSKRRKLIEDRVSQPRTPESLHEGMKARRPGC